MSLAELWVDVRLGFDKAERDLRQGAGKVNAEPAGRKVGSRFAAGFSTSMRGLGTVIAAAVSARAIKGLSGLAQEASDLNETVSKSQNIFGRNAKAIESWANTAAVSMGISKQAALDGAASFGNFFDQIGIGGRQSVKMSQGLVKLSSDLASFNNADPAQVMEAFQSATRGEYDSLQAFIPTVSAATVQTEALRLSHKKSKDDLTEADKALALYSLAQKDAGKAQGDFARTSGGLANQQRELKAQLANLRAEVGGALLPVFVAGATILNTKVLPALSALAQKHAPDVKRALAAIIPAATQIFNVLTKGDFTGGPFAEDSPFIDRLFKLRDGFKQVIPAVKEFFASLKAQGAGQSLSSMSDSMVTLAPAIREFVSQAHGVAPALSVGAAVLKVFASHVDTLVKFMPLLVAGYVAYKGAQLAANLAATLSLPTKIAEVVVNRQLVKSNRELIASRVGMTVATVGGVAAENLATGAKTKGVVATIASTVATVAGTVASKAAAIAAKALGLAIRFATGYIGIIITIVALAVTAIIALYKNNETFRNIVNRVWKEVQRVIAVVWTWLQAMFKSFMQAMRDTWTAVQKGAAFIKSAWDNIGRVIRSTWEHYIRPAIHAWATVWLTVVGIIVHGAAKALGWIPGVGDKLKGAAKAFDTFKNAVNRALGGVKNKTVGIGAKITFPADWQNYRAGERAMGGPIRGPGTGTSDTAGLYALSDGEHVVTAKEVKGAGGHKAMYAMRKAWASGVKGFARGGAVGVLDVRTNMPSAKDIANMAGRVNGVFESAAASFARKLQKEFSAGGKPLAWAKSQAGKPYIWGGVGPRGYDCSGFMSAIYNVIQGRSPYSRRFTTASFPTNGWDRGPGRFMIGRRRGSPGHMAGTLAGVNVESSGTPGVRVGGGARGAGSSLFGGQIWHLRGYARGGRVGDAPFDLLNPRGREYIGPEAMRYLFGDRAHWAFANGGIINEPIFGIGRSGRTYSFGEGGPETVTPGRTGGATLVNNGVITTSDVENWLVGVQANIKRKRRG